MIINVLLLYLMGSRNLGVPEFNDLIEYDKEVKGENFIM